MSFTVDNIMERVNSDEAQRIIEYIRDAFVEMAIIGEQKILTQKINMIDGQRAYALPSDAVGIVAVSVMDTEYATELIEDVENRDFSAASDWTNTDMATYDESDDLSVTNDAADQSCYLNVSDLIEEGHRYRLHYDCTLTSGTFELQEYTASTKLGDFADGEDNVIEFTAGADDMIKIVGTAAAGQADFDNFSLMGTELDKYRYATRIIGEMAHRYMDRETK